MSRDPTYPRAATQGARLVIALAVSALLSPSTLRSQSAGDEGGDALIRPGDVVRLTVWRESELTGSYSVNQFGSVVLPMVGEYDVSRETHESLRERVIRDLRVRIENPSIEVVVLKRVRVLGQVRNPGVFHLDPTMTVADALATAGGHTPEGREATVLLRRDGEVVAADLRMETRISDSRIQSGDELFVPPRGWFDRNTTPVLGAVAAFVGLLVALVGR